MSDKKDKKKDDCVILNEKKLNTETKADNPFKHLRAIPTGPLHTATTAANPFLASIVNKNNKQSLKQDNKPEKPVD
jgi:hypothetical protein